tara:strand:+ start:221 stop:712 length:492 start_codon:yes stop_codon:yes gene_type:complete
VVKKVDLVSLFSYNICILNKNVGDFMYIIVDKSNDSIHSEPTRKSYRSDQYKTEAAAKAGITRTVKFYDKAKAQVAEVVANGEPEYAAPMYNAFREATEKDLGRTHCADKGNYRVMHVEEYALIEPMITKTGNCPGTGKEITVTYSINQPHYLNPLSESYWSA